MKSAAHSRLSMVRSDHLS